MGCADNYKDWRDTAPFFVVKDAECIPCQSMERAAKVNKALFNDAGKVLPRDEYLLTKTK